MCGQSEADHFEKAMSRKLEQPEFKVDDVQEQTFREGYTTGFEEGMKIACEIKQENEQLKRRIIILEQQASNTAYDIDSFYE
jgi:NurA-like 5'-3' nuclease